MVKQVAEYKHFVINEVDPPKKRKTKCFEVVNKSDEYLGKIEWYGAWRQYCFIISGLGEFVFSKGCLDDISYFLGKLKEERDAETA